MNPERAALLSQLVDVLTQLLAVRESIDTAAQGGKMAAMADVSGERVLECRRDLVIAKIELLKAQGEIS